LSVESVFGSVNDEFKQCLIERKCVEFLINNCTKAEFKNITSCQKDNANCSYTTDDNNYINNQCRYLNSYIDQG